MLVYTRWTLEITSALCRQIDKLWNKEIFPTPTPYKYCRMLSLDGIFLFKLLLSSALYELFTRKHLSTQVQNSKIDKNYQLLWLRACTLVLPNNDEQTISELLGFCTFLFENFLKQKRIYKNEILTTKIFLYNTTADEKSGFSIKAFSSFIRSQELAGAHTQALCQEIDSLLMHIQYIQTIKCHQHLIVKFPNCRQYPIIFNDLRIQYEFIDPQYPDENSMKVYVVAAVGDRRDLQYKISKN